MAKFKRPGDPDKVVRETWYELGLSAVVSERYEDGGTLFFLHNYKGDRLPFTNIKRLNEEGSVITKEEAVKHLEATREIIRQRAASASHGNDLN
jgi:hypothetical protein